MAKNKYPLTTQTTHLFIVIRKNKKINKQLLQNYCDKFFIEWSFIEHEKDIEPITGLVEGCHYHIVGKAKKTKTPLATHLNDIVKFFKFDNANGIEIDKYDNYTKALQYLIHKNQPEKTQHDFKEVVSNISQQDLMLYMSAESNEIISFDFVYTSIYKCDNIVELIKELGFHNYSRFRNTIRDMWDFMKKGIN